MLFCNRFNPCRVYPMTFFRIKARISFCSLNTSNVRGVKTRFEKSPTGVH